jgi:hypothetical protein
MQERIRRPIAVFVVSVLLGAMAAGAALTVNLNGPVGEEMANGTRVVGTIEESLGALDLMAGGGRGVGSIEESVGTIDLMAGGTRVVGEVED